MSNSENVGTWLRPSEDEVNQGIVAVFPITCYCLMPSGEMKAVDYFGGYEIERRWSSAALSSSRRVSGRSLVRKGLSVLSMEQ